MKRSLFLLIASFFLMGMAHAQGNHFQPVAYEGEQDNSIYFWCGVYIDEVQQTSENIEVGMFINGVCRNTDRVTTSYNSDYYLVQLHSFIEEAGYEVTFKLYNHDTEELLEECSYSYTITEADAGSTNPIIITGDPFPVHLNFTATTPVGPEYPWVPVDPSEGSDNAFVVAIAQINGVAITESTNWAVGAFYGDICRGVSDDANGDDSGWVTIGNTLYIWMAIYGNSGEELTFKLYDKEAGALHPGVCDVTIVYENDEVFGSPTDPVILNFVTEQSFQKDIIGYTGANRFYLIASPIGEVSPANVTNMLSNNYDLYYFDQSAEDGLEWINYIGNNGPYNLVPGTGYLYANSQNVTLTFTGAPYSGNGDVILSLDPDAELSGWNLVGNPFAQPAYINKPFYSTNDDGSEIIAVNSRAIEAMEGVFVIADEDGQTLTFSTEPASQKTASLVMNVTQNRSNVIDRAIIAFEGNQSLPKFMLNTNNTKLYIQQDNKNYAMVHSNTDGEMPVNFKAEKNGNYTINVSTQDVELNYLHLIDHQSGNDVDLLATPSYSFDANENDMESRFTLCFRTNSSVDVNENSNPINYCQNGRLTINGIQGEGELEVIDVFGRTISRTKINDGYSQALTATPGIYVIRVTTENNTYTQKVVVK